MKTYPLSHPQKGVWYREKIYKGSSINNVAGTLRIEGDIDYALLEKAINHVIEKNDAIRLRFIEENGEPRQYISEYEYIKPDFLDFSKKDITELYKWDEQQSRIPFNLEEGPLFYFALLKIKDDEGALYIRYHHLVSDAWSIVLTANKIMKHYFALKNNEEIDDENDYSYTGFIESEQTYKSSERFIKDREFWLGTFCLKGLRSSIKGPMRGVSMPAENHLYCRISCAIRSKSIVFNREARYSESFWPLWPCISTG
jgi:hypothetical protein